VSKARSKAGLSLFLLTEVFFFLTHKNSMKLFPQWRRSKNGSPSKSELLLRQPGFALIKRLKAPLHVSHPQFHFVGEPDFLTRKEKRLEKGLGFFFFFGMWSTRGQLLTRRIFLRVLEVFFFSSGFFVHTKHQTKRRRVRAKVEEKKKDESIDIVRRHFLYPHCTLLFFLFCFFVFVSFCFVSSAISLTRSPALVFIPKALPQSKNPQRFCHPLMFPHRSFSLLPPKQVQLLFFFSPSCCFSSLHLSVSSFSDTSPFVLQALSLEKL
jgi:hypothetical protein